MKQFLKSVARRMPPIKVLLHERAALRRRCAELSDRAETAAARAEEAVRERDALRHRVNELSQMSSEPCYDHDSLRVWHRNMSFLEEPVFVRAYQTGMDSGHKIAREAGSRCDIHIEWRVHVCCWAAWHARHLPGDFVECGVNTGILSLAVCDYIDFNSTGKSFFPG